MNHLLRFLAVGTLLTAATSFAADAFEGKVTFAMTSGKGRTQVMNYIMKGSVLRMDTDAGGRSASVIMDLGKREMTSIMNEQHMYMVLPMPSIPDGSAAPGGRPGPGAPEAAPDIEKTGKTETILGYTCHQLLVKDSKGGVNEIWLADGLGMFMGLGAGGNPFAGGRGGGGGAAPNKWEQALKGVGGFPLRVITRDAGGAETNKMEVTKIEPGPQPDSAFLPPPGYQKLEMPGGMNPFGH